MRVLSEYLCQSPSLICAVMCGRQVVMNVGILKVKVTAKIPQEFKPDG